MPSESQFLFANQLVPWHGSRDLGPWYIRQPQTFPVLKRTPSFRCKWETREEEKIRPGVQASAMEACLFHWLFVGNRCLCVYVNVNVCMCVCIYICAYMFVHVCVCVYILCLCMRMSVFLFVCVCVCVRSVCMHVASWYDIESTVRGLQNLPKKMLTSSPTEFISICHITRVMNHTYFYLPPYRPSRNRWVWRRCCWAWEICIISGGWILMCRFLFKSLDMETI